MKSALDFFAEHPGLSFLILVGLEVAMIGLGGWLAIRMAKHDASTRYAIGVTSLVLMALAAPTAWVLQLNGWATFAWNRVVIVESNGASSTLFTNPSHSTFSPWIWVWLAGAAFVFLRIAVGSLRIHRHRSQSVLVAHTKGQPPVYATHDVGPAVVGAWRPAVLIPQRLFNQLADSEIRDVLAHEFAHVAHRHLMVALFQKVLTGLLWPHPLIHLINREVILAREEVCDNAVLRESGAARYARVLLRVAECRQGPRQFSASMGLFGPPTSMEERVKSLLDPNRRIDSKMNKSKLFSACLALSLGAVAIAGARIQTRTVTKEPPKVTFVKPTEEKAKAVSKSKAKYKKPVVWRVVKSKDGKPTVLVSEPKKAGTTWTKASPKVVAPKAFSSKAKRKTAKMRVLPVAEPSKAPALVVPKVVAPASSNPKVKPTTPTKKVAPTAQPKKHTLTWGVKKEAVPSAQPKSYPVIWGIKKEELPSKRGEWAKTKGR